MDLHLRPVFLDSFLHDLKMFCKGTYHDQTGLIFLMLFYLMYKHKKFHHLFFYRSNQFQQKPHIFLSINLLIINDDLKSFYLNLNPHIYINNLFQLNLFQIQQWLIQNILSFILLNWHLLKIFEKVQLQQYHLVSQIQTFIHYAYQIMLIHKDSQHYH